MLFPPHIIVTARRNPAYYIHQSVPSPGRPSDVSRQAGRRAGGCSNRLMSNARHRSVRKRRYRLCVLAERDHYFSAFSVQSFFGRLDTSESRDKGRVTYYHRMCVVFKPLSCSYRSFREAIKNSRLTTFSDRFASWSRFYTISVFGFSGPLVKQTHSFTSTYFIRLLYYFPKQRQHFRFKFRLNSETIG